MVDGFSFVGLIGLVSSVAIETKTSSKANHARSTAGVKAKVYVNLDACPDLGLIFSH